MPSTAITRPYEAVYILDPDSGEEQVAAVTARYKSLVETGGGEVQKVDVWERRKLAYEVKGRNEGIYVVMHFTGQAAVEAELRRVFQISEDQIRYLIVGRDEEQEALAPPVERSGPAFRRSPTPQAAPVAQAAPAAETVGSPLDAAAETAAPEAALTAA